MESDNPKYCQSTKLKQTNNKNYKTKIIVACTGSVATIKLAKLCQALQLTNKYQIKIVLTKASIHFLQKELDLLKQKYLVHIDQDQWKWEERGDPVLHIQLRKWADILLVAPLSANTLAKIVNGICDNLLTLIIRCWDQKRDQKGKLIKKIVVCPSMNTFMYENQLTAKHLKELEDRGFQILGPIQKVLMCGQKGTGAMVQIANIVQFLVNLDQFHN